MASSNTAPPQALRRLIDPIGEIEALAKKLCAEDLTKKSPHWEDYWSAAEAQLTHGSGDGARIPKMKPAKSSEEVVPELRLYAEQAENLLLAITVSALKKMISDHEARCVAYLLQHNRFTFENSAVQEPLSPKEASAFLAILCEEYDLDFLRSLGISRYQEAELEKRKQYWLQKLVEIEESDEPLHYADQNTIMRLRAQLMSDQRIKEISFCSE